MTAYNIKIAGVTDIASYVAGSTYDNVAYVSGVVDTADYNYMKVAIPYTVSLASGKTASFAVSMEQSADNSSWDTAQVLQAATVAKTADGAAIVAGSDSIEFDLHAKDMKRYVRFSVTPDLNNTATDTLSGKIVAMGVGGDVEPLSTATNTIKA